MSLIAACLLLAALSRSQTLKLARAASTLRVRLQGVNLSPKVLGVDELPGRSNYLIGGACAWRTNIPNFERVRYESVYPGINLVYYGDEGQLEYDFRLAPGAVHHFHRI